MSELNLETIEQKLRKLVTEICECEEDEVTMDASFVDDLGMDSMQALEILAAAEKEFGIQISEDYLGKIENLKGMIEIIQDIRGEK